VAPTTTTSTTLDADARILADSPDPPSIVALVGSDSRSGLWDHGDFGDFPGRRADVIVLAILGEDTSTLVSIPRDLWVEDICRGGHHRISAALGECGDTPGLANLVAELEHVTGTAIDHAVSVDLAGFQEVVDSLGGYEICTDYALRDEKSGLRLDSGCTVADGETTLRWLRSRQTERLRDGSWEPVPSVSDLTRNERQQQFLVDVLQRLTERSGPAAILDAAHDVAPYLTIDDELALGDLAAWVWDLRDAAVATETIPVTGETTASGAAVLVPTVDIPEFVEELRS
jgi:LCP family protein required for cell wall assembly